MPNDQIRIRYLLHTLLHKFTEQLFFAFGALLIYAKTGSILGTLLFVVVGHATTLLMKSIGFRPSVALFRKWGLVPSMTLGLVLKVITLISIFYLSPDSIYFYAILFSLHIVENIGNTLYVIGANTIMLSVIGASKTPGYSSAQITSLHTLSGLLAAVTGIFLNSHDSFLYLFIVGSAILLGSTIPLSGIPTPELPRLSFWKNLKTISLPMFLANIEPSHSFKVVGLPLIILSISASLDISIWITGGIAVLSIIAAYIAGWVKDHHGVWIIWLSLCVGVLSWVMYGFIHSPLAFLFVSTFHVLSTEIINVSREARMGTELRNNVLGGTMAFEFARALGILAGSGILLIVYLLFGNLPQLILIIGGLPLIPKAIYAVGKYADFGNTLASEPS